MKRRTRRSLWIIGSSLPLLLLLLVVADHPLLGLAIWLVVVAVGLLSPSLLRGR